MKIFLVSDFESGINFFPELKKEILSKILDIGIESFFVPTVLEIPAKAKELAQKADVVFVFHAFEEFSFRQEILLEKLVDLELSSGKKIIKAVEEKEIDENSRENEILEEKKALSKKYSEQIVDWLFHPEKFVPK